MSPHSDTKFRFYIPEFDGFYQPAEGWRRSGPPVYAGADLDRINRLRFLDPDTLDHGDRGFLTDVSCGLWDRYHMPVPLGRAIPTAHQAEAYTRVARKFQGGEQIAALFCEQGLGKTKISLMLMSYLAYQRTPGVRRFLIVAPGALCRQWAEKEIPRHWSGESPLSEGFPPSPLMHVWGGGRTKREEKAFSALLDAARTSDTSYKACFFLVNVEALSSSQKIRGFIQKFMNLPGEMAIVVDESSTIKNGYPRPKRPGSSRRGSGRANYLMDISERFSYRMILSGTPTPQSVVDLWSQFEFLRPGFWGMNRYQFFIAHTITRNVPLPRGSTRMPIDMRTWGIVRGARGSTAEIAMRYGMSVSDVGRVKNSREFSPTFGQDSVYARISPVTVRGRVRDLLDLPPRRYIRVPCEMTPEQNSLYDEMLRDFSIEMADFRERGFGELITASHAAAMTEKLLQITGGVILDGEGTPHFLEGGKSHDLAALILGFSDDDAVIYWAYHRAEQQIVYETVCERFGADRCAIYGGRSDTETIEKFRSGEILHLISGASAAFGHNFQHCHVQIFYSNSWRGDVRDQQEARTHRMGQESTCLYYDLVVEEYTDQKGQVREAIDSRILDVLRGKSELLDYFRGPPQAIEREAAYA